MVFGLEGNRSLKLMFCFLGLQASYVSWGIVQEMVMTQEYSFGKFRSSSFCVFSNRLLALIMSMAIVSYRRSTEDCKNKIKYAPFMNYAPSSLSNCLSSWAQYESLKYVSFPTQVLSKSCKIIPVMIVGMVLNQKVYPLVEYLEALAITLGVLVFSMSDNLMGGSSAKTEGGVDDGIFGFVMLGAYLFCDSFTSQWQSRVFKQHSVDQYQMMLGVNIWSILITGVSLLQSGDGLKSLIFMMADPSLSSHIFFLSLTSAIGQLFIFYTIKEFGPVTFTIMMTTRQVISLVISCLAFSHPMNVIAWAGAIIVFAVVFYRVYRKG